MLDQYTCNVVAKVKGLEWGGSSYTASNWMYTQTRTHTHTHTGKRASGSTFNLSADLGKVSHPFEDFRVRCLVSMRGLQREQEVVSSEISGLILRRQTYRKVSNIISC